MTRTNPYELGLDKNDANFVALSPLGFIERSAGIYPDRIATIYGSRRQTWRETYARCRRLAGALVQRGIGAGDTVATMQALLLGAARLTAQPLSMLLPVRHPGFLQWCLGQGFRAVKPMTLMTMGRYQDAVGCGFPSVLY